jgi:hypothetical protein
MSDEVTNDSEVGVAGRKADFLMVEYASIVEKMNGDVAWAAAFVGLYFAFLVSLCGGLGFLLFSDGFYSGAYSQEVMKIRTWTVAILSVFGLFLNTWAAGMVYDYKMTTRINLGRLGKIEETFLGDGEDGLGRATKSHVVGQRWTVLTVVIVGAVMFMMFSPWILALTLVL